MFGPSKRTLELERQLQKLQGENDEVQRIAESVMKF